MMAYTARTDMACELIEENLEGITQSEEDYDGIKVHRIQIKTQEAAKRLGKEIGTYITIYFDGAFNSEELFNNAVQQTVTCIRQLYDTNQKNILIAGLGNRKLTSDALGPMITERLVITRHLKTSAPDIFRHLNLGITAQITPDVLGKTGIESAEAVQNAADTVKPDVIFAIDALAAREMKKLCACLQISDTGISPGTGVGNNRKQLTRETMGVPVIAIGVPTVMDALTLASDIFHQQPDEKTISAYDKHLIVAPKDIDILIKNCAELISSALNKVFHHDISDGEIKLLTEM